MTMSALSDELAQVQAKKKEFLTQIEQIVPWKEWLELIQPCYYKGERGIQTRIRLRKVTSGTLAIKHISA